MKMNVLNQCNSKKEELRVALVDGQRLFDLVTKAQTRTKKNIYKEQLLLSQA